MNGRTCGWVIYHIDRKTNEVWTTDCARMPGHQGRHRDADYLAARNEERKRQYHEKKNREKCP